jgi:hypothetical protein
MIRWVMRGLAYWPSTLLAAGILAALGWLHWIGPDRVNALAAEVSGIGSLLTAISGALGAVPGLFAVGLALYRPRRDGEDRHGADQ